MLLRLHLHHIYCKHQRSFSLTLCNQELAICLFQEENHFSTQMLFTTGFHKNLMQSTVWKGNTVISVDITILLTVLLNTSDRQVQQPGTHFLSPTGLLFTSKQMTGFRVTWYKTLALCFLDRSKSTIFPSACVLMEVSPVLESGIFEELVPMRYTASLISAMSLFLTKRFWSLNVHIIPHVTSYTFL